MRWSRFRVLVAQTLVLAGCVESGEISIDDTLGPIHASGAVFSDVYELVHTVTPEQSDDRPIIRISGALLTDDRIIIVDVSEANAKVFDRGNGRLIHQLGRKGEGPGEFQAPRHPVMDEHGRLHVADVGQARVSVWNTEGALLREVRLPVSYVGSLSLMNNGSYVISGEGLGDEGVVIARVDSLGALISTHLPISNTLPRGVDPSQPWRSIRSFSARTFGDSVFVVSSISDSLWVVDLATGASTSRQIAFAGYESPRDASPRPRSPVELNTWANSFHTAASMQLADGNVVISFVKGVLNYGDPLLLVVRDRQGRWLNLTEAPPVLAANGDEVLAIANPLEDPVQLSIYRRR